jgi:hypothetical protein
MRVKPVVWRTVAIGLSALNMAGVGLAAGASEAGHAALHAALALVFGLWAQRSWQAAARRGEFTRSEPGAIEPGRLEALEEGLASMQRELSEAQERLDFAERLLAQGRDANRLPGQEGR